MEDERVYAIRLVWIKDKVKFAEYQKMARATKARQDMHIERWLETKDIMGEGIEKPDEIVVTWFDNAEAMHAFENDPEFKKAAEIRDQAVKLVTITAKSIYGE